MFGIVCIIEKDSIKKAVPILKKDGINQKMLTFDTIGRTKEEVKVLIICQQSTKVWIINFETGETIEFKND